MSDRTTEPSAHPTAAQLLQQGLFHHRQGQLDMAMDRYMEVLRNDPQNADALYYVAVVACQEQQFVQGIALAQRALKNGPPQARVHNLLGKALERQGDHLEAVKNFDAAIALDPNFAEAHGNRANVLAAAGLADEALKGFERALALDPKAAADWINYGALLQELGRHAEALACYDKALVLVPGDISTLMNRANALARLQRFAEAEAGYDDVIKRAPRTVPAYTQKALALKARERFADAIACLDQALAIAPEDIGALKSKARLLYVLGRLDEAAALFEQIIALAPDDARNYFELSEIKRFAPGDPLLAAMEKLLPAVAARPEPEQIDLHFALAKAYRDSGDHERAFHHLAQGNALNRRHIAYDENAVIAGMDRIRAVFTPELMRDKSGHGLPTDRPVFIIGMPRSGTTLIEQILASHPRVHGAGERQDFEQAIAFVTGRTDFPKLVAAMTAAQLDALGAAYLSSMAAAAAADRFTDKLPGNFKYAGLIHLALPNARIIHVQRDPIDTCLSCFATLFGAEQDFAYDLGELGRYYRAYERLMAHWRQVLPPGVMLDVQYEDVVADIETQARRMVAHCGLEWDDACLAFHASERPIYTASAAQVRQPLYDSAVERWRPYERQLQPLLDALGITA